LPIIKKVQVRELLTSAVVLNLGDVRREATDLIEAARIEAESILTNARLEAAQLTECAAEVGRSEGRAVGEAAGRVEGLAAGTAQGHEDAIESMSERLESIANGWGEALAGLMASRDAIREEARRDLLRLSLAIAERVLGRLPAHEPSLVEHQVSGAIEMLAGSTSLRITLNPEDVPVVEQHLPSVMSTIRGSADADVSIEIDPEMVRGGCVIKAGDGEIDARLDVQMSRIVSGLFPELLEVPPAESADAPMNPPVSEVPPSPATPPIAAPANPPIGIDVSPSDEVTRSNDADSDGPSSDSDLLDDWTTPGISDGPSGEEQGLESPS
jgi:flagellar biosynthesis/type III secretory pathway protein FliH